MIGIQLRTLMRTQRYSDNQLINMFDYFQEAVTVTPKTLHAQEIEFGVPNVQFADEPANNRYLVTAQNGQLVARVNYDATADKRVWPSTELFDGYSNLFRVDHYDSRGFASLISGIRRIIKLRKRG